MTVTSCRSSPPAKFYTLASVAPAHADRANADSTTVPLQVSAVHIPSILDRQEMVSESTATHIAISDQHRWVAPIAEIVRRVLTQDLAERLPSGSVIYVDEPAPARVKAIVVDILRFDGTANGMVVFDGGWSMVSGDTVVLSRHMRLTDRAPMGDYEQQAVAMSRILGVVADSIATYRTAHNLRNNGS
jgi:uncharacterized protein